jgi:hypothetical protein
MLWALRGVTLSRITIDGKPIYHLTPLNAVQKRILGLMEMPLVQRFVSPFQVKLRVAGKVEAHRAAVQMVWDAG